MKRRRVVRAGPEVSAPGYGTMQKIGMRASIFGLGFLILTATSSAMAQQSTMPPSAPPTKAEQQGRIAELTINGNRADVRVVKDGLTRPTGVTVVGDSAFVLVELTKGVIVPYRP